MSDSVIVQFVGFEAQALVREYRLSRRALDETSEFTLTIGNEAFGSRVLSDAPEICSRSSIVSWLLSETILRRHITVSARQTWTTTAVLTHQGRSYPYKPRVADL